MKPTQRVWWLGWLIAFLGFPVGGALATAIIGRLDTPLEGIIGGVAAGIVIGLAQWLALRRRLPVGWAWIAATALGLAAGVGAGVALFGAETTLEATLMRAIPTGLLLGGAQAWALRSHVRRAGWWIVVVALVYIAAWFVTAQVIRDSLNQGFVVFGASGALLFQGATGAALVALSGRRPAAEG